MEIVYSLEDFPEPGDKDLYEGIQNINQRRFQSALKCFTKACTYENEYATLFSGLIYFTGFGLPARNPSKAVELLKEIATKRDNRVAQYLIGTMYLSGDYGVPQNLKVAFEWVCLAANNGWYNAMTILGTHFFYGTSVKKDYKKAIHWFEKVAEKDDNETDIMDDGDLYLFGNKSFKLDIPYTARKIMETSERHNPSMIGTSFIKYLNSLKVLDGSPAKTEDLVVWSDLTNKKSAGVSVCQRLLSVIYSREFDDSAREVSKSMYYAKRAGKNGNSPSCLLVGTYYYEGKVTVRDYNEAMRWYKKSRHVDATFMIGVLYYNGKGVPKDFKLALNYFECTISGSYQGRAFFLMADIYRYRLGVASRDYQKAYECYMNAVTYGYAKGATEIGVMYYEGEGLKRDTDLAYKWFDKAVSMGCIAAKHILKVIDMNGMGTDIHSIRSIYGNVLN